MSGQPRRGAVAGGTGPAPAPSRLPDVVGRILALHDAQSTDLAAEELRLPAGVYVSEERFAEEQRVLFRDAPVFACLSSDVAAPGDFFTFESGGVPVVVLRAADGGCRAFVNICPHRAAPVFDGRGRASRSVSCPFHGWVYDIADGRLLGRPKSCGGFAGLGDEGWGLAPLPVAEVHGLVLVRPGGGSPIDAEAWLGGLGDELAGRDLGAYVPYRQLSRPWQCNWKLLLDTFFESYHVFALHRKSLGSLYLGIASTLDTYGPHMRVVVPQASILRQAGWHEDQRDLFADAVVQYCLQPAAILSFLYGYLMVWRFTPTAAGLTIAGSHLYTPGPVDTDNARALYDSRFEGGVSVTGDEDYPISEKVHRNLASGALRGTVLGRNEAAAIHFHREIARRLGDG